MAKYNYDIDPEVKVCPHCGCTKLQRASYLPNGMPRYKCTNCKKRISALTVQRFYKESDIPCPHCGSLYNHKMGTDRNSSTKRRKCRTCGKTFSDKTIIRPKLNLTCVYCGSHDIIRGGTTIAGGRRRYYCKSCGSSFSDAKHRSNGGKRALTQEQQNKILQEYLDGYQVKELAVKYNRAERTIRDRIKVCSVEKHLERAVQRLSTQTKRDIIYFGLGANVPVSYLSRYLHVDGNIVEKVLKDYKKKYVVT